MYFENRKRNSLVLLFCFFFFGRSKNFLTSFKSFPEIQEHTDTKWCAYPEHSLASSRSCWSYLTLRKFLTFSKRC